jgi:DNA-directed RNA polymerase subunit RPC12/RpoP
MNTATIVKYKCAACGAETEWDPTACDNPICVKCWDQEINSEKEIAVYRQWYRQAHRAEIAVYQQRYYQTED